MRKKIEDLFQRKQSYNSMHSLNTSIESTRGGCQRGASSPRPGPWPRSTPQSPGPPWGWVYGLGQNWSLQIQFLLLAQSLSVSFLSKRLHLAALVQKFPIFGSWWADFWLFFFVQSRLYFKVTETILPDWLLITGIIIPTLAYVLLFSGILEIMGTLFMSCICILFFANQRHLF